MSAADVAPSMDREEWAAGVGGDEVVGLPRVVDLGAAAAVPADGCFGADGGGSAWIVSAVVGAGWAACGAFSFVSAAARVAA